VRNGLAFVFALCVAGAATAQQEETLLSGPVTFGGFGGPVLKMTRLHDSFGFLVGGRGGWIINHTLSIGGGGYGLVNRIEGPDGIPGMTDPLLSVGYGGLEIEYIRRSGRLVHPVISLLLGAGSAGYRESWEEDLDPGNDGEDNPTWDSFFIAEPGIAVELNVTGFMRIDAGASYRFVSGLDKNDLTASSIGGPSAVLAFKFGKF
jgi:hypothetical protein